MSRWSEKFESNEIHPTLKQLGAWLDVEVKDIDAAHEVERRRLKKALSAISEVLGGMDPELFPDQQLTQLNQQLRHAQFWDVLQTYSSSPTAQSLSDANDYLTSIMPIIYNLAALSQGTKARTSIRAVEEAYDAFCSVLEKRDQESKALLREQSEQLTTFDQQAKTLAKALKSLEQQTESTFAEWQSEHTSAQTERAEAYSKAQIERGTKFDEALREWRSRSEVEVKEISAKHAEKLQSAFIEYRNEVEVMMKDMKAKHADILEIHGLVGTDGVAGGYQKGAKDEHQAANRWRRISMGALVVAAGWIFTKYWMGLDLTPAGEVNWAEVVTAASLTLVLIGASGYAARQSKLHRETEQHMRWFALEVKAIDPFLSSLPVEQQNDLKKQLTQKLFGQNRLSADKEDDSIDPAAFKSISDVFISFVKAIGKN